MTCSHNLYFSILLEVCHKDQDFYYKQMKRAGLMDFIEELITPEDKEEGIRLDSEIVYPKTILVKKITFENVVGILGQVKFLSSLT